jgi:hypothetical protein
MPLKIPPPLRVRVVVSTVKSWLIAIIDPASQVICSPASIQNLTMLAAGRQRTSCFMVR